jgi:hypothetical protein
MTRFRLAPSTVIALLGVLAIGSCDPCDPCDGQLEQRKAARASLELPASVERGAPASH